MNISAYLHFNGNCEEALEFYAQVLGGKIEGLFRYAGTPVEGNIPAEWREKVMHAALKVENNSLLACDPPPGRYQAPQGYSMCLSAKDPEEAERIFQALAEGGTIEMPMQTTFWSARFGMLKDRFGIAWMINCEAAR